MTQITTRLAVPDIHCPRCKESIEGAVGGLDGVAGVDVDVAAKVVTVTHDPPRVRRAPGERGRGPGLRRRRP